MRSFSSFVRLRGLWWLFFVVLLAFLFSIACVLPNILQRMDPAYVYRGISIMPTDQEYYYATRAREIFDGFSTAANAYRVDHKFQPYMQPVLPEWIIAQSALLLRMTVPYAFLLFKGLFSFILFVVFAGAFSHLSGQRWLSLVAVTALLFSGALFSAPWDVFSGNFPGDFLRFARPINPQWSASFFFGALWIVSLWLQKRQVWHPFALGILCAAMLYTYYYAWSYMGLILAILLLFFCLKRDWVRVYDSCLLACIFFFLGIPYWINTWALVRHPWYIETAMRQGLSTRYTPLYGFWLFALLFIGVFSDRRKDNWPLIPAAALAAVIVLNQNVLTGLYLVPHHYHWYFIQPLAVVLSSVFLLHLLQKLTRRFSRSFFPLVLTLACIASLLYGYAVQWNSYLLVRSSWGERQVFSSVLNGLQPYAQPGTVIFASAEANLLRELIPIYTSADVYSADNANNFLTPFSHARDAYFFELWLRGIGAQEASVRFFRDLRAELSGRLFSIYYREYLGQYTAIPDTIVRRIASDYDLYLHYSLREKLALYPVAFVFFTPFDPLTPAWLSLLQKGVTVFDRDGYRLIDVRSVQ